MTEEQQNVLNLVRQLEGVENNAFVSGLLLGIFNDIVEVNQGSTQDQFDIMMGVILQVNQDTFAEFDQHMLLPEDERDFILSGALSAQEAFYQVLIMAYSDDIQLSEAERIQIVQEAIQSQIDEAEALCKEPLEAIRRVISEHEEQE